jgi:UDP-N-acetylmuramyl pentapeptide phosphotransferase/UDP-N-acetylglucosamine-1-phosphate transferase
MGNEFNGNITCVAMVGAYLDLMVYNHVSQSIFGGSGSRAHALATN